MRKTNKSVLTFIFCNNFRLKNNSPNFQRWCIVDNNLFYFFCPPPGHQHPTKHSREFVLRLSGAEAAVRRGTGLVRQNTKQHHLCQLQVADTQTTTPAWCRYWTSIQCHQFELDTTCTRSYRCTFWCCGRNAALAACCLLFTTRSGMPTNKSP